jgi:hypothetical protein
LKQSGPDFRLARGDEAVDVIEQFPPRRVDLG